MACATSPFNQDGQKSAGCNWIIYFMTLILAINCAKTQATRSIWIKIKSFFLSHPPKLIKTSLLGHNCNIFTSMYIKYTKYSLGIFVCNYMLR